MISSMPKGPFGGERVYPGIMLEKIKGVHMVMQVLGGWLDDALRHWLDLPNNHGGMHVMILWYSQTNERVH